MGIRQLIAIGGGVVLLAAPSLGHSVAQPSPPRPRPAATTKLLANMDLESEIAGLAGKSLRTRLVTITPGGTLPEHSHEDRPSVMYLTEGRIIEHRRNFAKEYVAGDTFVVGRQVPHWSENPGPTAASYVEVDVFTQGPVPIVQEPRHKVVFESGTTRIHDVQIPPGDTSLYHVHDTAILYVPISRSQTRSQVLGEEWSGGEARTAGPSAERPEAPASPPPPEGPGRVNSISSYVDTPVTHRVNNVGDSLFRLIAVVNQSTGSEADADDVSGLSPKPELLNRYFRAHRVRLAPGQATSRHRHATPIVVVQQTAGRLSVEGATRAEVSEPGAFAFDEGRGTHEVKNVGDSPVDLIEVELRGGKPK